MVMGDISASTDVVVLGAGPGGYAAAFRAADRGLDTMLVTDEEDLGGVCLLRGCIPSKALLEMTERLELARQAAEAGISFGEPDVDPDRLRSWTEDVVRRLSGGVSRLAEGRDVRVVRGHGRFDSDQRLRLQGSDLATVDFDHAIIATGSEPVSLPDAPFEGPVWDSAAALELDVVPDRLLVVGAGYVGLELGTVYARLGSEVVIAEATDGLLPGTDRELVGPVEKSIERLVEEIRLGTPVESLEVEDDGVRVRLGDADDEERFDRVLVAVGRRPRSHDLGLEEAGVELDQDGVVVVDEHRRTSTETIYAVGDVAGGLGLAHEAMHEGKVAADVIAGEPAAWDVRAVPAVIYTDPEIAYCGLMEEEASERGVDVRVARFPLRASGRALTMGGNAADGLVKLVLEAGSDRILGAGIVGPQAESLIAEAALAVEMGATATDVALTIHPHPTLSEAVGEAADVALGTPTHVASP